MRGGRLVKLEGGKNNTQIIYKQVNRMTGKRIGMSCNYVLVSVLV